MKKYIILSNSTSIKGEKVGLVDRKITGGQWWTQKPELLLVFNSLDSANEAKSKLKFNNPQVYELDKGLQRLKQVEVANSNSWFGKALAEKNQEIGSVINFD